MPFLSDLYFQTQLGAAQPSTNFTTNNADYSSGLAGTVFDPKFQNSSTYQNNFGNNQNSFGNKWFGQNGYLNAGAGILSALGGLANAYTGLQQLDLAKDEFGFNKALAQRNLANQADLINEQRLNAANVGLALAGDTLTDEQKNAKRANVTANNVSGTV